MNRVIEMFNLWCGQAVTESTSLESLDFDSMDKAEMAMMLEDEFNIEIDSDASFNWATVGDVVQTVEELTK